MGFETPAVIRLLVSRWKTSLGHVQPNTACIRLGTALSGYFSSLEFVPFRRQVHTPTKRLTRAVRWLQQVRNVVYFHLDTIERAFYNLMKENSHEKNNRLGIYYIRWSLASTWWG